MVKKVAEFHIFALAALGQGISGGDRIFIEFARQWSLNFPVDLFVWEEGKAMCERQNLEGKNLHYNIVKVGKLRNLGFLFTYIYRIFLGIKLGLTLKIFNKSDSNVIVYSASEFWMDSLPALILKLRYSSLCWVAAWYQTAPNPLVGFKEGKRKRSYFLHAFYYWLMQLPIKPLIDKYADYVVVNNEDERKQFPARNKEGDVIVLIGAVPLDEINKYISSHYPPPTPKYDAVFQGRFHPQKGVVELIEIWKKVVEKRSIAKLAMIGDGPLMGEVKSRISDLKLTNNVKLFGYVYDGPKKYKIFSQSKIVVHPAFYDSGGMASAEAMAFGLPCVGFDLKAYKSYYPKGMYKVKIGDKKGFAGATLKLLNDKKFYNAFSKQARQLIGLNWSWEVRSEQLKKQILSK